MRGYRSHAPTSLRVAHLTHTYSSSLVPTAPEHPAHCPARENVVDAQQADPQPDPNLKADEDGLLRQNGKAWIP